MKEQKAKYETFKYDFKGLNQNEEFIKKDYQRYINNEGYTEEYNKNLLLLEEIFKLCEKHNLKIYKYDLNCEKSFILQYENNKHFLFIHFEGLKISNITKTNNKISYLSNGQLLKGYLKGNKKDIEIMNDFKKSFEEQ